MATLYIDIQTIPSQDPAVLERIMQAIRPPANYTQAETRAKWYRENLHSEAEKKYRQTALDGLLGEIFSIAWAVDDGEVLAFWRDEQSSERGLLDNFMQELADLTAADGQRRRVRRWVGHCISGFDLRFLWQRCVVNQVRPSLALPLDARLWDERVFDTQLMWSGGSYGYGGQSSLPALAQGLGLGEAVAMQADQVYQLWLAGRYDEIAVYNRQMLSQARELYRRMCFVESH